MKKYNCRIPKKIIALSITIIVILSSFLTLFASTFEGFVNYQSGDPTEIVREDADKREEFSRHFVTGDGSFLAVSYSEQVGYYDGGKIREVNNNLGKNILTGNFSNSVKNFRVRFANKADANKLAEIKTNDYQVSWGLAFSTDGENYSAPNSVKGATEKYNKKTDTAEKTSRLGKAEGTITYHGVLPNADLQYILTYGKIKENIILNAKTNLTSYRVEYKLERDVTANLGGDGSVLFEKNGEVLFIVSARIFTTRRERAEEFRFRSRRIKE